MSSEEFIKGQSTSKVSNIPMPWDQDFEGINFSDIDRILNFPGTDDIAGVLARANFKNDEDRIACLLTYYNLKTIKDEEGNTMKDELEFFLVCIASTLGLKGFGKTLQLQSKVNVIAPELTREQLGLSKSKNKNRSEQQVRGSDFRDSEVQPRVSRGDEG